MSSSMPPVTAAPGDLREVALVFLRLGLTAFGGPVAHIAAMEDELVARRGWITRDGFADLVGAANLIPGPNSTELAIHLGYHRAGWRGLVVAGVCFIVPAVLMVWALAWGYGRIGARVEVQAALAGMQPAVLAVVVQAAWRLRGSFVRSTAGAVAAVAALVAVLGGISEFAILLAALLVGGWLVWRSAPPSAATPRAGTMGWLWPSSVPWLSATSVASGALAPGTVFLSFLKIGSVLYGSGYVLLTFLRGEFVTRLHLLTDAQLLDAIAIGQITPGPVFCSATFVGYLLAGHAGALAATIGIFLPAFVAVALTAPMVRRLRANRRLAPALDVVNAVSLALMVAVVGVMARGVAASGWGIVIFLVTTLLLLTTRVGAGWVLLASGLTGLLQLR